MFQLSTFIFLCLPVDSRPHMEEIFLEDILLQLRTQYWTWSCLLLIWLCLSYIYKCNQTSPSNEFTLQLHGSTFMFSVPACHGSVSIFGIHICFCHVSGDCANTEAGLVGHTAVAGRDPLGTAGSSQSWRLSAGERCMGWIWLDIEKHGCFCLSTMLRTSAKRLKFLNVFFWKRNRNLQ